MPVILVIDDRPEIRLSLVMLLEDNGYQVIEAENPQQAKALIPTNNPSLILLDMNYAMDTTSGEEGLEFLDWLKKSELNIPAVAMTAWSNIHLVVKAMQFGAGDFIEKPWKNKRLLQIIGQQLAFQDLQVQNSKLKQQLADAPQTEYVWRSDCMLELMRQIEAVASTDVSILLTGDNGTGKSELAHYIHKCSNRQNEAFVSVNMGAISEPLFESEIFGHKKGAFTDAKSNRIGRFQLAEKGTLFLDEIVNIPLSQQVKLLRVLESGEYEILGSSQTQNTNIRIVCATNGDINKLIEKELFREDLYYRLNTLEFRVPSLAQRQQDIIPLTEFFLDKFTHKYQRGCYSLTDSARQRLLEYSWPGNIRELSHLIERAVLLAQSKNLSEDDLHLSSRKNQQELPFMTLEQAEIKLIKMALDKVEKNIPQAAKLLGLTKSSMYRRLEKHACFKD